ncbi:ATPase AAA-type core domain-containing protein [Candidatus Magnetomoraceae bacterium gMMP-15]
MIKYFSVKNFRSIKEECIIEFDTGLSKNSKLVSNPVIGIAGANASGKTSVLQAITFVLWFLKDSFLNIDDKEKIPVIPFCTTEDMPTNFHIIFSKKTEIKDSYRYVDYEYILNINSEKVLSEYLYYYPYGRKREAYIRDEDKIKFGRTVKLPTSDLKTFKKNLRNNCSIISYAAQYDSQFIAKQCHEYGYESNVDYSGMKEFKFHPAILKALSQYKNKKNKAIELLRIADIGIEDFQYKKVEEKKLKEAIDALKDLDQEEKQKLPSNILNFIKEIEDYRDGKNNSKLNIAEIFFVHSIDNGKIDFHIESESSGTIKFLELLYKVISSLENGSLLILDEIELKLHQDLVAYIIGLYQNEFENIDGSQLLFSFHNSIFMKILEPEQLWFTEKNDYGNSEIFSASHFEDIKNIHDRNLEKLYRIGRFGAKPRGL